MNVWLIELTEPLPVARGGRLMRCGMLADRLATDGHEVTWWSSDFDHVTKRYRAESAGGSLLIAPNYRIELLAGSPYQRNVSLARVQHHRQVARAFAAH